MTPELRSALSEMLNDLEAHKLEVQLAPLNPKLRGYSESGMKRVVVDAPPKFYRALCNAYVSSRSVRRNKFDTRIRRRNVLRSLRQLIAGVPAGKYGPDLLRSAKKIAATVAQNPF